MEDSILRTIKKLLGLAADYDVFDQNVIVHINDAFMALEQLGVGPTFFIESDNESWGDYLPEDGDLQAVKSYIYIKVRLVFDPPSTSFAINSLQEMSRELEWRLNVQAEKDLQL